MGYEYTIPDFTASVDTKNVKYPVNIGQVSVLQHILKVIRVPASIINHTIKPTIVLMLILYLLHTIFRNSDMLRSILTIFRELLNKVYIKHRCIIKYVKICACKYYKIRL
jgi:hypothetical protein